MNNQSPTQPVDILGIPFENTTEKDFQAILHNVINQTKIRLSSPPSGDRHVCQGESRLRKLITTR